MPCRARLAGPWAAGVCLALAACGARSTLGPGAPERTPAGLTSSAAGGPAMVLECGTHLTLPAPADVATAAGAPDRPALVFGSDDGRVVAVFHALGAPAGGTPLEVAALEPWGDWPP